jgi:hypothetical protein
MSAAMLWKLGAALGVGPNYFFDGLGSSPAAAGAADEQPGIGSPR